MSPNAQRASWMASWVRIPRCAAHVEMEEKTSRSRCRRSSTTNRPQADGFGVSIVGAVGAWAVPRDDGRILVDFDRHGWPGRFLGGPGRVDRIPDAFGRPVSDARPSTTGRRDDDCRGHFRRVAP